MSTGETLTIPIKNFHHLALAMATTLDKSLKAPDQVPDTVQTISHIIESRIAKYNNSGESTTRNMVKKMTEEDAFFIEAVMRISKLTNANASSEFPTTTTSYSLNGTTYDLQKAMVFLEEELRFLLEDSKIPLPDHSNPNHQRITKSSSFKSKLEKESCRSCILQLQVKPDQSVVDDEDFLGYFLETVTKTSTNCVRNDISGIEK